MKKVLCACQGFAPYEISYNNVTGDENKDAENLENENKPQGGMKLKGKEKMWNSFLAQRFALVK